MRSLYAWRRPALFFLAGAAVGAATVPVLVRKPWASAVAGFEERRAERDALAPLIDEARSWSLAYDNVAAGAKADIGKPVLWCIDHPAKDDSYVGGNASWRVRWTDEDAPPMISDAKHGCRDMVAVIRGSDSNGVLLEFKGLP